MNIRGSGWHLGTCAPGLYRGAHIPLAIFVYELLPGRLAVRDLFTSSVYTINKSTSKHTEKFQISIWSTLHIIKLYMGKKHFKKKKRNGDLNVQIKNSGH